MLKTEGSIPGSAPKVNGGRFWPILILHPRFVESFRFCSFFCETCWQTIGRGWRVNITFSVEGITCTSALLRFNISCLICLWRKHKGRRASPQMFFLKKADVYSDSVHSSWAWSAAKRSPSHHQLRGHRVCMNHPKLNFHWAELNWIESVVRWRFTGTQGHGQFSESIIHLPNMLFNVVPAGAESIWLLSEVVNPEASVLPPTLFLSYLIHSEYLLKAVAVSLVGLKVLINTNTRPGINANLLSSAVRIPIHKHIINQIEDVSLINVLIGEFD